MKTTSTFKNQMFPRFLLSSLLVIMFLSPGFAGVKHIVTVTNNKFTPKELTISKGDTVEWRNIQGFHNVNGKQTTYPQNPQSFGNSTGSGWTYSFIFTNTGNYNYQCDPHVNFGMTGKIEVVEKAPMKFVVTVTDFKFSPDELQINVGDTVEWQNTQGFHNVNGTTSAFPANPESFGNSTGFNWTYRYVFSKAGKYDYQCDPHAEFGMVGKVEVKDSNGNDDGKYNLTVNFSGMTPHVGQTLSIALIEKNSGKEVERKTEVVSASFSINLSGLEMGHSYNIDFFSDHNKNGKYDAPPADHAWRMELNDVMGDETLNFQHNTTFTDIMWKNKVMVHFMGMTPHVGQNLQLAVIDKNSGTEIQRVGKTVETEFMIELFGIENGMSYNIDFFSDHNKNGKYDAPPADHAWRMNLNDVKGDTILMFMHNTNFTDIMWKNKLTVHFMGMTPHVGQNLQLAVIDKNSGTEIQRVGKTVETEFMIELFGIENGMSYNVDFFSDHNKNGKYDAPPADHAWRMNLDDVKGDTILMFMHNTTFTNINWITTSLTNIGNTAIKIYPNPATDKVFIETGEIVGLELKVTIFDITGRMEHQELINAGNRVEVDVKNLKRGLYFIQLETKNSQEILKFLKQ
jgi:plastocyanin